MSGTWESIQLSLLTAHFVWLSDPSLYHNVVCIIYYFVVHEVKEISREFVETHEFFSKRFAEFLEIFTTSGSSAPNLWRIIWAEAFYGLIQSPSFLNWGQARLVYNPERDMFSQQQKYKEDILLLLCAHLYLS
jgi:hypothetical protein